MEYEEFKKAVIEALKDEPLGLRFKEIKAKAGIQIGRVPGSWIARLYAEKVVRLERRRGCYVWILLRQQR